MSVFQRNKSRQLSQTETQNLLAVLPEHITMQAKWMGYPVYNVTFKTSKEGTLRLQFRADTRYWQPDADMETWMKETIGPYLPETWTLTPLSKPRLIDVLYHLNLAISTVSTSDNAVPGVE